jgi:putative endonuclease
MKQDNRKEVADSVQLSGDKQQAKKDNRKAIGTYGEQLVLKQYEAAGFKLLAHQYHCRWGEIDLIMQRSETIYFIEVRTKTNDNYGTAAESISPRKIEKIRRVSEMFLFQNGWFDRTVQFDFVSVKINKKTKQAVIERISEAF